MRSFVVVLLVTVCGVIASQEALHFSQGSTVELSNDLLRDSDVLSSDDKPLLQCKTVATTGPKNWGHAIVYCPRGWQITGGGMQSNFGAFERAHPYFNGYMCDNNHGWGSGICFARCCKIPGFQYVSRPAVAANITAGKEAEHDNVASQGLRHPIVKVHLNTPILKYFSRATAEVSSSDRSVLTQWTRAVARPGYCEKALTDFTGVSNKAVCNGPRKNVMYRVVAKFFPLTRGTWNFHLGSTFKGGVAIYMDGALAADARGTGRGNWAGTWEPSASLISTGRIQLDPKKWHTLDIFGFSGPNNADAPFDIQFSFTPSRGATEKGRWQPLTMRNLQGACD